MWKSPEHYRQVLSVLRKEIEEGHLTEYAAYGFDVREYLEALDYFTTKTERG